MSAYYNEIDKYAAEWLRNLIRAGHIADGVVDERSIEDVRPNDLREFTQVHFFAGIGVWSLALRRAGWADDRRVWTGSCPCQPFSSAGKGAGFSDERHLWPAMHHLIRECRPASIFGEQVASADAAPWLDLVQTDLEGLGYAFGAVPFPSASVGAPHIRDRTYWVADAEHDGRDRPTRATPFQGCDESSLGVPGGNRSAGGLANAASAGLQMRGGHDSRRYGFGLDESGQLGGLANNHDDRRGALPLAGIHDAQRHAEPCGGSGGLADASSRQHIARGSQPDQRPMAQSDGTLQTALGRPGPVNGFWSDADWLRCRDGRWRPVEPGTFPLVDGVANRVGRLRAYGNAINAIAAEVFIRASMI